MKRKQLILVAAGILLVSSACDGKRESPTSPPSETATAPQRAKSAPGARVFIIEPQNGATVSSPVTIKFGAEGIALEKAGTVVDNSGHHHLLVDTPEVPAFDQPLPFSDRLIHFGQAQTEASLNLTPGTHTLQLIFAGGNHIPHDPPVVSERIAVTVR